MPSAAPSRRQRLIAGAVDTATPIWTLNLGQYRDPCANCETGGTSWQRPFIVIAVKETDPGTNVGEALTDAMSGKEKLPSPAELLRLRPDAVPLVASKRARNKRQKDPSAEPNAMTATRAMTAPTIATMTMSR